MDISEFQTEIFEKDLPQSVEGSQKSLYCKIWYLPNVEGSMRLEGVRIKVFQKANLLNTEVFSIQNSLKIMLFNKDQISKVIIDCLQIK